VAGALNVVLCELLRPRAEAREQARLDAAERVPLAGGGA